MPRLVDALPKYRKHRASGQAVVTLNGRDHYLGPYGTSASEAFYDRLIAEWLIQERSASAPATTGEERDDEPYWCRPCDHSGDGPPKRAINILM